MKIQVFLYATLLTLICSLPDWAAPLSASIAGAIRTIHFPVDQSVGMLVVAHFTPAGEIVEERVLGPARGDARVPAGKLIALKLNFHGAEDLSFLDKLAPDDLAILDFANDGRGFDIPDQAFAHFGRLSGLLGLNLQDSEAATVAMRAVGALTNLIMLDLTTTLVRDADLEPLTKLKKVRCLELSYNHLSDAALVSLRGFSELRKLRARRCGLTGAGIKNLVNCRHLVSLTLADNLLGDSALTVLPVLPELDYIDVGDSNVGDQTLLSLSRDEKLVTILASYGHYSRVGLAGMARLPCLNQLYVEGNPVTVADLADLAHSPKLGQMQVTMGQLDRAEAQKLLPRVRLLFKDPKQERKQRFLDVLK